MSTNDPETPRGAEIASLSAMGENMHTPGPWRSGTHYVDCASVCTEDGEEIAWLGASGSHNEANARLIATAPQGLALARMVVDVDETDCGALTSKEHLSQWLAVVIAARRLIVEAEGT